MTAVPAAAIISASGVFSRSARGAVGGGRRDSRCGVHRRGDCHGESSGDTDATSPTGDFGLWQITAVTALATRDPLDNAKAAVLISDNGTG